ncbi:hypothetical protein [Rhizobium sp. RAF56]|uniref:hypothetical protein n=1 Tax=Rhizobium sp. RAF56 TaxID=3233062 RepID=UPI003F9BA3A9
MTRPDRKPERIGPEEKLGDIAGWEMLLALCKCEHFAEVDIRKLKRKFGAETVLRTLEPKLKCAKCGGSGAAFFAVKLPR